MSRRRTTILLLSVAFVLAVAVPAGRAATPFFSSEGGFHISALMPQPLISRDWGMFGNLDAPGTDFVSDMQWRFIPASNDVFRAPAAVLDTLGNLILAGALHAKQVVADAIEATSLTAKRITADALDATEITTKKLVTDTLEVAKGAFSINSTGITLGKVHIGIGEDTGQRGDPALIYDQKSGIWMLRGDNGYFDRITTSSTDRVGGGSPTNVYVQPTDPGAVGAGKLWSDTSGTVDWYLFAAPHVPEARYEHALAYDAARSKVILFGGYGNDYLNDTWTLGKQTVLKIRDLYNVSWESL